MKKTLVMVALAAFVACGSSTVFAKDMNAEHSARVMAKQVAKQQKAEAEKQKAQQAEAAQPADVDKRPVRAR